MKIFKRIFTVVLTLALMLSFVTFSNAAEVSQPDSQDIKGDINLDGSVNAADALTVLQHAVKIIELTDSKLAKADVNKDGIINSSDALQILIIAVGLEKKDPTTKEEIVAFYNECIDNSYKQDKIVLEGFTNFSVEVNEVLIDGQSDDEVTDMFEEILMSTEYEDIELTFINGKTEDGVESEAFISSAKVLLDEVDTATAIPFGEGYKITLTLYPQSQTWTEDELEAAISDYTSYTEEISEIEILAVTDGQGRITLLDLHTHPHVKATAVDNEFDVEVYMDFEIDQRDIYTFTY